MKRYVYDYTGLIFLWEEDADKPFTERFLERYEAKLVSGDPVEIVHSMHISSPEMRKGRQEPSDRE